MWPESKVKENVEKLVSLSKLNHLSALQPVLEKGLTVTLVDDEGTVNGVDSRVRTLVLRGDQPEHVWAEDLKKVDVAATLRAIKERDREMKALKTEVTAKERRVASLLNIAGVTCGLDFDRAGLTTVPAALNHFTEAERHLQACGMEWKKAYAPVKVRIASYPFLGEGQRFFASAQGQVVVPNDCKVTQLIAAIKGAGPRSIEIRKHMDKLEPKRFYAERVLGLELLTVEDEWFEGTSGAVEKVSRAYTELEKIALAMSNSVKLDGVEMRVADRFALDHDGSLIIPWDFTYAMMREFLLTEK
jgi:hypothetical protein